jgi:excisionase family DNA binding protein
MDDERWYTVGQVAERWQLNAEVVRRWIRGGKVDALELGGKAGYRIRASEVERFERDHMRPRKMVGAIGDS